MDKHLSNYFRYNYCIFVTEKSSKTNIYKVGNDPFEVLSVTDGRN
jgi:hypothetical protein